MAEWLFKKACQEAGLSIKASSAGISAFPNLGATDECLHVLKSEGLDAVSHKAQKALPKLVREADLIFVMQPMHRDYIVTETPESESKVYMLGDFMPEANGETESSGIQDPIGMGSTTYKEVMIQIKKSIQTVTDILKDKRDS